MEPAAFKADDNAELKSYLQTYINKWNTAWPTDWVLFSSHPTKAQPTRELTAADRVVQAVTESNRYTFINCCKLFGPMDELVSEGVINSDKYHLSAYGSWSMERFIFSVIENAIIPRVGYTNPAYYDGSSDREVLSFTNAFGAGAVPKHVWSAQYTATNDSFQFNIGECGIGRMGWSSNGHLFITGGDQGWGYSNPPAKPSRVPSATAEIFQILGPRNPH